jgi:phospholipid-binding lipoprotein MlaA
MLRVNNNTFIQNCLLIISFFFVNGCATLDGPPNPDDPFESFNRSMFAFNEAADKYAFKPAAEGYNFIMPDMASKGVTNFFNNIDDIVVFFNELLQFKIAEAVATSARVVFNSTFGLLGLIDVSTPMGLPKHNEDFGQTLAVWGVGSGPYLVLPFIGPNNIRDTAGLAVDWTYFDPIFKRQTLNAALATITIKYIDVRAGLLKATNVIDETAPDKYSYIRDAWLQRREYLIYDGYPPKEMTDEELFKEEDLFKDENLFKEEQIQDEKSLNKSTMENNAEIFFGDETPAENANENATEVNTESSDSENGSPENGGIKNNDAETTDPDNALPDNTD